MVSRNLSVEDKLLMAQMASEGITTSTISFFIAVRPLLNKGCTKTELATAYFSHIAAINNHLERLSKYKYVISERRSNGKASYSIWHSLDNILRDKDLIMLYQISWKRAHAI